jgi:hypothetical protein
MKRELTEMAREINAFCARLNAGLTAVAILLAFLVVTMGAIRAQDYVPQPAGIIPVDYQQSAER